MDYRFEGLRQICEICEICGKFFLVIVQRIVNHKGILPY